jgi:ABC-type polysaccharide/polyol phosphate transport system ATPase subunit
VWLEHGRVVLDGDIEQVLAAYAAAGALEPV